MVACADAAAGHQRHQRGDDDPRSLDDCVIEVSPSDWERRRPPLSVAGYTLGATEVSTYWRMRGKDGYYKEHKLIRSTARSRTRCPSVRTTMRPSEIAGVAHDHFLHLVLRDLLVGRPGPRDEDVAVLVGEVERGRRRRSATPRTSRRRRHARGRCVTAVTYAVVVAGVEDAVVEDRRRDVGALVCCSTRRRRSRSCPSAARCRRSRSGLIA